MTQIGTACVSLILLLKGGLGPQDLKPTFRSRPSGALSGSAFAQEIASLPLQAREERIEREVLSGNVPSFLRAFQPVDVSAEIGGRVVHGRLFVLPDYLAVGSDDDYLYVPTTPYTAQRLADKFRSTLPTPKIVDAIYAAAVNRLVPSPIPPAPAMTTVPWFLQISQTIAKQRAALPPTALTAGDKKDIVICKALKDSPGKVAIYGWHRQDGKPIQPLYLGHIATWADYSHGIRLVSEAMELDGQPKRVAEVLADPVLSELISGEGPVTQPRYVFHAFPHPPDNSIHLASDEEASVFSPVPGVRVLIDSPKVLLPKIQLVLFALPNGNTIEQTMGRKLQPDDDWHFDIQHIAAQTRFVRRAKQDESLVVAYMEASNHAWPTWLRSGDPRVTVSIVDQIVSRFKDRQVSVTLNSHSGGGAFEFAYLASVDSIPDWIDRIAFLDSEYAYETALHAKKLTDWLQSQAHFFCAIAYDDASALLEGKPFVSAQGGTWGRTHLLLGDLGSQFEIKNIGEGDPEQYSGLGGRIVFWLKLNPKHEIFHTVQVERNGFIESLLSGSSLDEKGYCYFGKRAYAKYVAP